MDAALVHGLLQAVDALCEELPHTAPSDLLDQQRAVLLKSLRRGMAAIAEGAPGKRQQATPSKAKKRRLRRRRSREKNRGPTHTHVGRGHCREKRAIRSTSATRDSHGKESPSPMRRRLWRRLHRSVLAAT